MPITLPFIPWTGGLNRKQHATLAHPSQLREAMDVVYDFDGTRHKRGGQTHRNRIPIPGGKLDDHFRETPPGSWTATGTLSMLSLVDRTIWRGQTTTEGSLVTLTKTLSSAIGTAFSTTYTARIRLQTTILYNAGAVFTFSVQGGTGSYDLGVRFSANSGIQLLTAGSTYTTISSSSGTFEDMSLPLGGRELFDTDGYHTWRFDLTSTPSIKVYFDELLIFTSNTITLTTTATAGATMIWDGNAATIDVSVDYVEVEDGTEHSVVHALYEFPRPRSASLTAHQHLVAAVNGRVYVDTGHHRFDLVLDNNELGTGGPLRFFSFAAFRGDLLIARGDGNELVRYTPGETPEVCPGNPPRAAILRVHRNRVFAAGDILHPSRLYWSGLNNEELWTTETSGDFTDSGFVDIDPDDGGVITGIGPSFHGELVIYKTTGIYRLSGTSFDDFVMAEITKALGAVGHHCIQNVGNDQFFVSRYGVHSLLTTQKFGDYEQAYLSNDIRFFWNGEVAHGQLNRAWAVNNERFDRYEILCPTGSPDLGYFGDTLLCLHYGVADDLHPVGRWSMKTVAGGSALAFADEDDLRYMFIGSLDGFVNRQDELFHHDFPVYKASAGVQGDVG